MKPFLIATAMTLMVSLTCPPVQADEECLELLEQKCTSCHYNTRICKKLGKKNTRAWKSTVKRMLRYGLKMDKQEQEKSVDCLLSMKKDPGPFCK
jgi:hypothetical protein